MTRCTTAAAENSTGTSCSTTLKEIEDFDRLVVLMDHLAPVQTAKLPGCCFKLRDDVDGGLRRRQSQRMRELHPAA
jgi:hypothetical protein